MLENSQPFKHLCLQFDVLIYSCKDTKITKLSTTKTTKLVNPEKLPLLKGRIMKKCNAFIPFGNSDLV